MPIIVAKFSIFCDKLNKFINRAFVSFKNTALLIKAYVPALFGKTSNKSDTLVVTKHQNHRYSMNSKKLLPTIAVSAMALVLCISFTFSWICSKVDYLNTVIKMGDFSATVNAYYEDGTLLATGSTTGDDVALNEAISSDTNWAAGTTGYRFIEIKNTGTIDIRSYIECAFNAENFNCDNTTVTDSFYYELTDITKDVEGLKADETTKSKITTYSKLFSVDTAKDMHQNGANFTSFDSSQSLGNITTGSTSYYVLQYCCYDLSPLVFDSNSFLSIGTKVIVQQIDAPAEGDNTPIITGSSNDLTKSDSSDKTSNTDNNQSIQNTTPNTSSEPGSQGTETTNRATWEYEYLDSKQKTIEINKYNGTDSDVVIPSAIGDAVVVELSETAFDSPSIKSVTVPATVSVIRLNTFAYRNIKNITINEKTNVNGKIFVSPYACDNLVLYNADKTILYRYMPQKSLEKFTIPDTVKTIGDIAFGNVTNLKELHLGKTMVMSTSAFRNCSITDFYFSTYEPPIAASYSVYGGISIISKGNTSEYKSTVTLHVPTEVFDTYKNNMFFNYYAQAKAIVDDGELDDGSVATILYKGIKYAIVNNGGQYLEREYNRDTAYEFLAIVCDYTSIPSDKVLIIPETVNYEGKTCPIVAIKDYAFENCLDIEQVVLPSDSVAYSNLAFKGCENLGIIQYDDVIHYDSAAVDTALPTSPKKITPTDNDDDDNNDNNDATVPETSTATEATQTSE